MTRILFALLFLVSARAMAQQTPPASRFYRSGDQVTVTDSLGGKIKNFNIGEIRIEAGTTTEVWVTVKRQTTKFPLAKFLNQSGVAYSTASADAAISAYLAAIPASGGGGGGTVSLATSTGTDTYARVTTSGTIASGAAFVSVFNEGTTNATWAGQVLPAKTGLTFPAIPGKLHGAFTYDPNPSGSSGNTLAIITTRP